MDMMISMKRFVSLGITCLLVLSAVGMATLGTSNDGDGPDVLTASAEMAFSPPDIREQDAYTAIRMKEATSLLLETGAPVLPVYTETFTFPFGTSVRDVSVELSTTTYRLEQRIAPAPRPVPRTAEPSGIAPDVAPDPEIYGSNAPYPAEPYRVRQGTGLQHGEHVLHVTVSCYPQYIPSDDMLRCPEHVNIRVEHTPPGEPLLTADIYDLLVITDQTFRAEMERLADHKESLGVSTLVQTTQHIYSSYNGRDNPERIKRYIRDAIEDYGVDYVLLAGGRKGQTFDWYIPEARSNNDADMESGYASDLYYADVYDADGDFADWDSNGNGVIAEYGQFGAPRDEMDFYPDVYVGRLPIRYSWEAGTVVDKIIAYETGADSSWFKQMFMAAGDTSPPARDEHGVIEQGVYEGELVADRVAAQLSNDFNVQKMYTSDGSFHSYQQIVDAFTTGAGFAYFSGHGNPGVWGNFLPDAETEEEFVLGFTDFDIWKYENGDRLPVVVIGGCHNAQFNVSVQHLIDGNEEAMAHGEYYPHDGASWMALMTGGSIGTVGYTGYGYGYINSYCTEGLGGWIEPRFFNAYAQQGMDTLGGAHGQAITDYISIIGGVNSDQIDRKTIESWALLGDPSLQIGGARTRGQADADDTPRFSPGNSSPASMDEAPTWEEGMRWTYAVDDVTFAFDEVDNRSVDLSFSIGDITLEVVEVSGASYRTSFHAEDLSLSIDSVLDLGDGQPTRLTGAVSDGTLDGHLVFDADTLGITAMDAQLSLTVDPDSLPLGSLPPFVEKLLNVVPVAVNVDMDAQLEDEYPLLSFPLDAGDSWGLPAVDVDLEGTVMSFWFRVAHLADILGGLIGMELLPDSLADMLPVVTAREILALFNMSADDLETPSVEDPLYHDIHLFQCGDHVQVSVPAGTYDTRYVGMIRDIGRVYYAPEVGNVVKITGGFGDILPIMEDISIELVDHS